MNLGVIYQDYVLNALYGGVASTPVPTLYLALYTVAPTDSGGGSEVSTSGTNYSRLAITNDSLAFGASIVGVQVNASAFTFPTATATWSTVVAFAFHDDPTLDQIITWGDLTSPVVVNSTDTPQFAAGTLTNTAN